MNGLASKRWRVRAKTALAASLVALGIGCGGEPHPAEGHRHGDEQAGDESGGHAETREASSGARYEAGQGVFLSEEIRRNLGLETAEAAMRHLPLIFRFTPQVFDETHRSMAAGAAHVACVAKASGLIAREQAAFLRDGMPVRFVTQAGDVLGGVILKVHPAVTLAFGDAEVVAGVTNAGAQLAMGEFLAATVTIPRAEPVLVVPQAAVLRSVEGAFVYVANGDAYLRREIKTGAETEEGVEVVEGLRDGEAVVVRAVETLRLIELRATKGGGHAH